MKRIKLKALIAELGLNVTSLARELFPTTKYPELALKRVMKGNLPLDEMQISKLSALTGISIPDLFMRNNWELAKPVGSSGKHLLSSEQFTAEIDINTGVTLLFENGSMFHETVLHSGIASMSAYTESLNEIINNHKTQKFNVKS